MGSVRPELSKERGAMCNSLRTRQLGLQQLSQHPAQSKQSQGLCQPVMVEKLDMGKVGQAGSYSAEAWDPSHRHSTLNWRAPLP